jgi:hypothetical protein
MNIPEHISESLLTIFWVKTNEESKNPKTPNSINLKGRRWNWQLAAEKKELFLIKGMSSPVIVYILKQYCRTGPKFHCFKEIVSQDKYVFEVFINQH